MTRLGACLDVVVRSDPEVCGLSGNSFHLSLHHGGQGVFAGLPNPLTATRYHSLIAERESLPACLEITAWLEDGTIMGLRHRAYPHLQGVQFHPESILTGQGHDLINNFIARC